jgi:hypothetical protein
MLFGIGVIQVLLTAPGGIIADLGRLLEAIKRRFRRSPTEPAPEIDHENVVMSESS